MARNGKTSLRALAGASAFACAFVGGSVAPAWADAPTTTAASAASATSATPAAASTSATATPAPGAVPNLAGQTDALSVYAPCTSGAPSNSDAAHGAYIAGKGSFDVGDYGTALAYFKDAYTRDCTKNELLLVIVRAYELLPDKSVHNKREALHALETYVERMPNAEDTPRQKERIKRKKEEIADQIKQENAAAAAASQQQSSGGGSSGEVREHTAGPWVVAGAGVAVAASGLIVYLVGAGKVSDAESGCGGHDCSHAGADRASLESEGTTGNTLQTVGGIMLAVGGASIVGGLLWHFLEPTGPVAGSAGASGTASAASDKALFTPTKPSFRFDPLVRPGFAGLGAVGTF